MAKLQHRVGDAWVDHSHPRLYRVDERAGAAPRVLTAAPGGDPAVFARLVACLEAPLFLLYVLHTPRGEGEPGRYQSEEIDHGAVEACVARFGSYLANDGRFDLWAYSPAQQATVVWDRHNQIFAYGASECFESALRALDFTVGHLPPLGEHIHFYREEYDHDARDFLTAFDWHRTPLREQDEQ